MSADRLRPVSTADGAVITALEFLPEAPARAGLVVLAEMFGLNDDIRRVAAEYAADGYHVLAPNPFDRTEPGVRDLPYTRAGLSRAASLRRDRPIAEEVEDAVACVQWLRAEGRARVGMLGFCHGGWVGWLAAGATGGPDAVAVYYGGRTHLIRDHAPGCPGLLHYGEQDAHIPLPHVREMAAARAETPTHLYPEAGHGFNTPSSRGYHAPSAILARARTLALFRQHLG